MAKHRRADQPPPPCYAIVFPGLESVAGEEITEDLGGEVKRSGRGFVVFRLIELDAAVLRLRTTEDVFLLGWGTDQLTYRAEDLNRISRWTARDVDWPRLLQIHHGIRPKPKGKPTFRLVTQMTGEHGYRRRDAHEALARGLAGKLPAGWRHAEENAAVEVWLTIHGATAVCGLRLSDRTMRHRHYKREHLPASLRPTIAAAMVRLAGSKPGQLVLDPMCGAGTILAEQLARDAQMGSQRLSMPERGRIVGGDLDVATLRAARSNLRGLGQTSLVSWDARRLPFAENSVDRVISNPPFGKQLGRPEEIGPLYRRSILEYDRVLRPGGRAVLLAADAEALQLAIRPVGWKSVRQLRVRVLGQMAAITVWRRD